MRAGARRDSFECLHSPILSGLKVFSFQPPALVSQLTVNPFPPGTELKDQQMRIRVLAPVVAGLFIVTVILCRADVLQEDFSSDPAGRGWRAFGQTNLFHWNSTNQNLEVTWDSSQTNSYFCQSLGTILAAQDDFGLAFDLLLTNVLVGVNTNKPYTFELAVGFLNLAQATGPNFLRGAGAGTPDFIEFDYFPDDGSGPSLDATLSDTNSTLGFYWVNLPLELNKTYRVNLNYASSNQTIQAWLSLSNAPFAMLTNSYVSSGFTDFRLDHVAVCSYSDVGQDPTYSGSLLADGIIDNIVVTLPPPPVSAVRGSFKNGAWEVQFVSRTNWLYTLERTVDFQTWATVSATQAGNGTNQVLQDAAPPAHGGFYRVRANRP